MNPSKCFDSLPASAGLSACLNVNIEGATRLPMDENDWPAQYFSRTYAHFEKLGEPETLVLARLRNQYSKEIAVVFDQPPHEATLFGLGFKRIGPFELNFFGYDLSQYNHTRDWNNARFWANPERWGKDFW